VRNTVVILVLAFLAAATWVWTWPRQDVDSQAEPSTDTRALGYYARSTRILLTDEQGRVTARVRAERLDELADEELLRLEGVNVEYQAAGETAWVISATTARTPRDGSELELAGSVELRSQPDDGSDPIVITATTLRLLPDSSEIESDDPVSVRFGAWQLDSGSLHTNLQDETLRLESGVYGKFAR
jgi:LPS export ABC transporter protein LptC